MKWEHVKDLSEERFRRETGIKKATFEKMIEVLIEAQARKNRRGGRPNKLSMNDRLLMALEYLREYRTYNSISISYGLSESNTFETIRWIEDTLIKSKLFHVPGKKALLSDNEFQVVLIDASESPIERPKKNKNSSTQEKRNAILSKPK